jgi:guanylate kinase
MSNKIRGVPFVVSGPSGAGKTTLYKMAVDFFGDLRHSVSYTTRRPRAGETNGVEYHFIDDATFDRMVEEGEFFEYASVHGRKYGTSRTDLELMLDDGMDVMLEIDVQGAHKLKRVMEGGVYVFIIPPSIEECRTRLTGRGQDDPDEITRRLNIAIEEIKNAPEYDYIIVNDVVEESFDLLKSVVVSERIRSERTSGRVREIFGLV